MALGVATPPALALPEAAAATPRPVADIRIPELDGLRGLMALFVLYSHYFVEVPNGIGLFSLGWVAVLVFFVLSGYLVGRLILEKKDSPVFLTVFYLRRAGRTFPTYFLSVAAILWLGALLADRPWMHGPKPLPVWSYFTFSQPVLTIARGSVGMHWLTPTWTLALEEQFYLLAPLLFLLAPQRVWLPVLCAICLAGLALRAAGVVFGFLSFAPLMLLPASADVLSAGVLLAVLVKRGTIDWERWSGPLRAAPIGLLLATAVIQRIDGGVVGPCFQVLGPFLVSIAAALFILILVKNAPEARRFRSPVLRFFGDISYSVYLTHLAVLGLMHGLILGAEPGTGTPAQVLVTLAALPVAIGLGWLMTRCIEQPITARVRRLRW